jgi:hypothetical protein
LKRYAVLHIILFGLLFASCTASPAISGSSSATSQIPATQASSGSPSGNSASPINTPDFSEVTLLPAEANSFVRLVEEDLASRLQIPADQIHFLKISDVDWQDLTQGCTTETSQTSTKGRVSGYRIWLKADGKNFLYHIGLDNTIIFCTQQ